MDIVASIIQVIPNLITSIYNQTTYLRNLSENLRYLSDEADMIQAKYNDLKTEADSGSREGKKVKEQVKEWLRQAQNMKHEIDSIKSEFDRRQTLSLLSRHKLGRRTAKKLQDVRLLSKSGKSIPEEVFSSSRGEEKASTNTEAPRQEASTIPAASGQEASTIPAALGPASFQKTLMEVLGHLDDERKRTICVYGMGGIGKTHLMEAIQKELEVTHKFKVIIRVTASKDFNRERFQMEIMESLEMDIGNESYGNRSKRLYGMMSRRRYVLIVDDLWQKIDLKNVGIPVPDRQNGSKIVITTRLVDVCHAMSADAMIRMRTLTKGEAWELFSAKVGVIDWEPHIEDIAANVVEECGGMPLAITTVAEAMHKKTDKKLWQSTLTSLEASAAHEIEGMVKQFKCLKPSYDELNPKVKMCFLYCSLFPKGHDICVNDLVNIWTIEEFIDEAHNLVEASDQGHKIVDGLKNKCLLEGGTPHDNNVKMHHVIRSFAVWITSLPSHEGGPASKFFVKAGKRLKTLPPKQGQDTEIISLMGSAIKDLSSWPKCCNLVSLFLRNNPITDVPHSFFELMPRLKILDLSVTNIESLTISSSSLPMLRALILKECKTQDLKILGQLKELEILDLSYSSMITLPCEMLNLHKLKRLDLSYIDAGLIIPPNNIYGLSSLVDLSLMRTKVMWARQSEPEAATNATYGEEAKLKDLISLEIYIHDINCVEEHVPHWPWSKLEYFKINIGQFPLQEYEDLNCAKQMHIEGGDKYTDGVKVIAAHTQGLMLHNVHGELVSQLVGDLKRLESLKILFFHSCWEMECIVDCPHVGENALENIEHLNLYRNALQNIEHLKHLNLYRNALQNIEHLNLYRLPKLKKLFEPVSKVCLKKLRKIVVQHCNAPKSLFSSEMVEDLGALQYLDVRNCAELEKIIQGGIKKRSTEGDSKPKKENTEDENTVEGEF